MLKIQEFILAHDNWRELLSAAPYNLKIAEDDGFVIFKYNQIESDFNEEICKEARGLILDSTDNFKAVRMAFKKFFNLGESHAAKIDWDSAVASEKIDGSIMSVWYARGKWHLSTNGTIDAFKAPLNGVGPYKNFGELFTSVMPLNFFEGEHFGKNWADLNLCFTFELVSPYNKVVIDYPETKVYLLSMREMDTLNEIEGNVVRIFGKINGFNIPQEYKLRNEKEFCELVESMSNDHEGIVVRDMYNERVKIKTKSYFELHRMVNNGVVTVARMVELIRANDQEEFLSYFCEYKPMFDKVTKQLKDVETLVECVETYVTSWKEIRGEDRKEFAEKINEMTKDNIPPALFFAAWDNKTDSFMEKLSTEKFIKMFKIGEDI